MKKCFDDLAAVKTHLDGLDLDKRTDSEIQLRSYELGYVIYDKMGEDFVSDLFTKPRPEWLIRPPDPDSGAVTNTGPGLFPVLKKVEADNVFIKMMPFLATREETVPYMAYGTNMSSNRIRQRLNWTDPAGKESLEKTNPVPCTLKDYRLAFNRVSDSKPTEEGLANLKSEKGEEVEGVLYQLPKTAVDFLEQNEPGYHGIKIKVSGKGGENEATVFVADTNQVGPETAPNQADITSMIEGAAEHGLSEGYLKKLRSYESQLPALHH
jgi:cation transport regulator ChaC